jgi:hypothetical protein
MWRIDTENFHHGAMGPHLPTELALDALDSALRNRKAAAVHSLRSRDNSRIGFMATGSHRRTSNARHR